MIGRCERRWTATTREVDGCARVVGKSPDSALGRGQPGSFPLPARIRRPMRSSSTVAAMPRLRRTGLRVLPTRRSSELVLHVRAPTDHAQCSRHELERALVQRLRDDRHPDFAPDVAEDHEARFPESLGRHTARCGLEGAAAAGSVRLRCAGPRDGECLLRRLHGTRPGENGEVVAATGTPRTVTTLFPTWLRGSRACTDAIPG